MKTNFGKQTLESMNQADWYNKWTLDKFKNFLNGKTLEVGCGIGTFTHILSKYGKITAIDIDNNLIEVAKNSNLNIKVGYGNVEKGKYFFEKEKFDTIVCINVLEHIEKDQLAIKNIHNLLNKEGHLILLVPAHPFLYGEIDKSIGHFRRYKRKDIVVKIESGGFKIIDFRNLNLIGSIGWFIFGRILKNKIVGSSKIKLFNLLAPIFLRIEDLINPPFGTSFLVIAKKI